MEPLGQILRETLGTDISARAAARPVETTPACPICHDAGYVRADVGPDHPDFGRALLCRCQLEKFEKHRRDLLREQSFLGPLASKTFATLRPEGRFAKHPDHYRAMVETAKRYAAAPDGWLVLAGVPGSGKTHLAAAVANAVIDSGQPALFLAAADLLDHLRATFGPSSEVRYDELFDSVSNAPLLVLDDLSARSSSSWASEKLFQILNRRYNAQLPTVITLASPLNELDERLHVRLTDIELSTVCVLEERESPLFQRVGALSLDLLRSMTFETFTPNKLELNADQRQYLQVVFQAARMFAESPDGWMVFAGPCGTGKTHLAAAIANARLAAGEPAFFAVVPDLLDHLRSTFSPDSKVTYDALFETVRTTPLLILDDIGAQSNSPWAEEKLYQVVNYRYNARLPTVFTTNHGPADLDQRLNSRLADKKLSTGFFLKDFPDMRADVPTRPIEPRRQAPRKR